MLYLPLSTDSACQWAKIIHANNVEMGWWDKHRPFSQLTLLICSELAEAMEGLRKDIQDDHLPQHKMYAVEMADAAIRTLDLAGYLLKVGWLGEGIFGYVCARDVERLDQMGIMTTPGTIPRAYDRRCLVGRLAFKEALNVPSLSETASLNELMYAASGLGRSLEDLMGWAAAYRVAELFASIVDTAARSGIDLCVIMQEKLEYNSKRADHKRENRAKAGGKAF